MPAPSRSRAHFIRRWGVVEHWALSEASGAGLASISGANGLTDNNTVTSAAGKVYGTARQFTAANSESLSVADNEALSGGAFDFWGAAWVYLDSKGAERAVMSRYSPGAGGREWFLTFANAADRFSLSITPDNTFGSLVTLTANTFGAPSTAAWYFVMFYQRFGSTIGISVNGGAFDTAAFMLGTTDSAAPFWIGRANDVTYMDGRIGPAVYGRSPPGGLTVALATEIRDRLWNGGNGRAYPWR
jgi:hypothetical protein